MRAFMLKADAPGRPDAVLETGQGRPRGEAADVAVQGVGGAFVTSELEERFQIGFLIFIPFLVIDMIVASVLMSLGMMMLSPVLVALPFKLMLFVLADG